MGHEAAVQARFDQRHEPTGTAGGRELHGERLVIPTGCRQTDATPPAGLQQVVAAGPVTATGKSWGTRNSQGSAGTGGRNRGVSETLRRDVRDSSGMRTSGGVTGEKVAHSADETGVARFACATCELVPNPAEDCQADAARKSPENAVVSRVGLKFGTSCRTQGLAGGISHCGPAESAGLARACLRVSHNAASHLATAPAPARKTP